MFFRLLFVAAMFFTGAPAAGTVLIDPSSPSTTTAAVVARLPSEAAVPTASSSTTDKPVVKEHPIAVPAIGPAGEVLGSSDAFKAQVTVGGIVADTAIAGGRVRSQVVETGAFQTVGVTWPGVDNVSDLGIQVRARVDGAWSQWASLAQGDNGPDTGSPDAIRGSKIGTDPLWVGNADAVQLSFAASHAGGPAGLSLALVDSAETPAATTGSPAEPAVGTASIAPAAFVTGAALRASVPAPHVITRAEWGASPQACTPGVASGLVGAVVHHTDDPNTYTSVAQAMQQIRNDQAYHINSLGWCDIGYNFLVDKWGNIYEGRAGSMDSPVIGAHAGGFNTGTVGIAMLGTYSDVTPSAATQEAVAQVIAWRLSSYYRDPTGSMTYTTSGGSDKYAAGSTVTLPVVVGHRDVYLTACPGSAGYATLGWVRSRAKAIIGASLVNPALSSSSVAMGTPVSVVARTISNLNWTLNVTDARTGVVVAGYIGYAQEAFGGVVATWDGLNLKGEPVGPGPYNLSLSAVSSATGLPVTPWSGIVQVTGSQNPPSVAAVPLASNLTFVPIVPVRLVDTRTDAQSLGSSSRMDLVVTGVGGIPVDAKAVSLNVTTVNSSAATFVRVWPAGQPTPAASSLNTDSKRTTGAGVVVGVGGEHKVSFYNNAGSTHLVVDATGYFTDAPATGSGYQPLVTGARVLDTRTTGGPMTSGERRTISVAGRLGIPLDATAVLVNVSSVGAQSAGYISAFPSGGSVPVTASVNHLPGTDVSNRTIVPLSSSGQLDLVLEGGSANVVLDVVGWFGPTGTLRYTPVVPVRGFDTRVSGGAVAAGETRSESIAAAGLPAAAQVAVVSLAATQQSAATTFVTTWASGAARPVASDLNTGAGRDQANLCAVPLVGSSSIQVYNDAGSTELVGDVLGYFG